MVEEEAGPLVDLPRGEEPPGAVQVEHASAQLGAEVDVGTEAVELVVGQH